MPTADRTTIKAALDALINDLRANLTGEPPTATRPFRRVVVGEGKDVEAYPRPFLAIALTRIGPIGVTDDDKLWEASTALTIVTDLSTSDAHPAMLDAIGAVEDRLDTLRDTGLIEGAEGFDDREWALSYPRTTAGARVAVVSATQTFVVKVERNQNRVPAP